MKAKKLVWENESLTKSKAVYFFTKDISLIFYIWVWDGFINYNVGICGYYKASICCGINNLEDAKEFAQSIADQIAEQVVGDE